MVAMAIARLVPTIGSDSGHPGLGHELLLSKVSVLWFALDKAILCTGRATDLLGVYQLQKGFHSVK